MSVLPHQPQCPHPDSDATNTAGSGLLTAEGATIDAWLERARVEPILARRWMVKEGWKIGERVLLANWLMWIESGSLTGRIEGTARKANFGPGTLVVIPAGIHHSFDLHECNTAELVTVHFNAPLFETLDLLDLAGITGAFPCPESSLVASLAAQLCWEHETKSLGHRHAMRAQITQLLLYLLRNYKSEFRPRVNRDRWVHYARLQPILAKIDAEFLNTNLSVPDLASEIAVSEVYLRRIFNQVLGIGPAAYMQRQRVRHAGHLLRTTTHSVKEIARMSGFNEPHFFMRVFRKWMRQTPTEFRSFPDV